MLVQLKRENRGAMASPWRRRRPCLILARGTHMAALTEISGRGATLECSAALDLGDTITLAHPEAGRIEARVEALTSKGISIAFEPGGAAMAFALAAITADMSDPAY